MKKVLVLLLLLALEACIPVKDLGDYWWKAGRDPDLAGSWRVVAGPPENIGLLRKFDDVGGAYGISVFNAQGKPVDTGAASGSIRTLELGRYKLLIFAGQPDALGKRAGIIERYKLEGNDLEVYGTVGPSWLDYVPKKHPNVVNLKKNRGVSRSSLGLSDTSQAMTTRTKRTGFCGDIVP